MTTLTKSLIDSLAYIHITGKTKGLRVKTVCLLEFDLGLVEYDMRNYKRSLTEKGLKVLEGNQTMGAYNWLIKNGFEFHDCKGNRKSFIQFRKTGTKREAYISTQGGKTSLYVSNDLGYGYCECNF